VRSLKPDISNKAVFPSLWRLVAPALCRSAGWSPVKLFVRSPWWWRGGEVADQVRPSSISGAFLFLDAAGAGCSCSSPSLAMVVRRGLGIRHLPVGLKNIGEILWIMSSSKLHASLPWLSLAGMAAVFQPPLRRPLVTLLRKLDDILPPSGFVPSGLMTAVGRRYTSEGSQRATCSRSSAAMPGGRRCSVAEAP
jgi:hypothetical protein